MIPSIFSLSARNTMTAMGGPHPKLIGWGTGSGFYMAWPSLPLKLDYVIDPRPERRGDYIQGLAIHGPDTLAAEDPNTTIIVIFSEAFDAIAERIKTYGPFAVFRAVEPRPAPNAFQPSRTKSAAETISHQAYITVPEPVRDADDPATNAVLAAHDQMVASLKTAPDLYHPDIHWAHYAQHHRTQLARYGVGTFKATINQEYFQLNAFQMDNYLVDRMIELWPTHHAIEPLLNNLPDPSLFPDQRAAETFKLYTGLLWELALAGDTRGLLPTLEEPLLGSPVPLLRQGRRISQDLANSYREFLAVADGVGLDCRDRPVIAELGAGYGRLAWVFGKLTKARYWIIDIPPTLALSQWYLETLFPDEKIFRFRPFEDFSTIADELAQARFAFFTPDQTAKLPDHALDILISISSLHEMSPIQVAHYLEAAKRLSRDAIYIKQWVQGVVQHQGHFITHDLYRLGTAFTPVFDRRDLANPKFFETLSRRIDTLSCTAIVP